jgi:hypothetical protein
MLLEENISLHLVTKSLSFSLLPLFHQEWSEAKKLMGDMQFLEKLKKYDKDNIPPKIIKVALNMLTQTCVLLFLPIAHSPSILFELFS